MTSQAFECPECGGTEWKADYYEAVWQTIKLVRGEGGEPEFVDYTGVTGTYDDPSTEDEAYRCRSCEYTITLGTFEMLPLSPAEAVKQAQAWARREFGESNRSEAADEAIVHLARLLGVEVKPDTVGHLYLDPEDVEDEEGAWVDRAILMVMNHVGGGAELEVARIDPADIDNREYVEVTLTDGRTFAVRAPREES
jgi:hypothetical protein